MSDALFWVPHDGALWVPGRLAGKEGGSSTYETDLGTVLVPGDRRLDEVADTKALQGVDDICSLDSVTDASLLHTVRVRYLRDEVYTNISRIVIAVNPFKALGIYSEEWIHRYRTVEDPAALPPHVFGVAADAFAGLVRDQRGQAVLISGESGAGKSESTKLVLLYASEVLSTSEAGFSDKLLEISPILEAFGNAKTVRNSNSSRFGKWIEVLVEPSSMSLGGALVTDYLLEVTRVCSQGPGERNYHIFYQLAGDGSGTYDSFKINGADKFAYLRANPANAPEINDEVDFLELRKALVALGFSEEEQDNMFRIVAGILHLGNIVFTGDDAAKVVDTSVVDDAANMLGCSAESLKKCVCFKRLTVGKDTTESPLSQDKAGLARDSMAKLVYGRLFRWLVSKCNVALGAHIPANSTTINNKNPPFIGVLDIAGFENFQTNMLEQLHINLSNEKLQQFFNESVFKSELSDYAAEGLEVGWINFADNADILTLIEGKGGILQLLDEATNGVRQTDALYTTAVTKAHEKHPRFVKSKFPNTPKFGIRHFAGDVTYTTDRFLEKNASGQPQEVIELLESSSLQVVRDLAAQFEESAGGGVPTSRGPSKKATVSQQFRKSLQQLVDKLRTSTAHFVRCVKPNTVKVPGQLNGAMVDDQLRRSGIMEAVKIRKAGFAVRQPCADFVRRFIIVLPAAVRKQVAAFVEADPSAAARNFIAELPALLGTLFSSSDVAVGKTKVFVKDSLSRTLERRRLHAFTDVALKVGAFYRGYRVRVMIADARDVDRQLRACLDDSGLSAVSAGEAEASVTRKLPRATLMEGSLASLDILIGRASSLSIRLPILGKALKARARLNAEAQLGRQLKEHRSSTDVPTIEAALARAAEYRMQGELVDVLRQRLDRLQAQGEHRNALRRCAQLGLEALEEAQRTIDAAKAAGLDEKETWALPEGPELFAEALRHLELLHEQRRAAEEEIKRIAEEEEEKKRLAEEEQKRAAEEKARMQAEAAEAEARKQADAAEAETMMLAEAAQAEARLRAASEAERRRAEEQAQAIQRAEEEQARRQAEKEKDEKKNAEELIRGQPEGNQAVASLTPSTALGPEGEALRLRALRAKEEYDARELGECLRVAEAMGLPYEHFEQAHQLFLALQCGEFVHQKLEELRGAGEHEEDEDDMENLLVLSNLSDQLEALGLKEQPISNNMREVAGELHRRRTTRTMSGVPGNVLESRLAAKCFGDLTNFSRLRDPLFWGHGSGGGISMRKDSFEPEGNELPPMLRHSRELPEPLTQLDPSLEMAATRSFGSLLRFMGDKPSAAKAIGDKAQPLIDCAKKAPELCDEVFVQVMKQLTDNPSMESTKKGWQLLHTLVQSVRPSAELSEFLRAFLNKEAASAKEQLEGGRQARRSRLNSAAAEAEVRMQNWPEARIEFLQAVPDMVAKVQGLLDADTAND